MGSYKNRIKFSETTYIFAFLLGYLLKVSYKTFVERLYFELVFWLPVEGGMMSSSHALRAIVSVIKKPFGGNE